MSLTESFTAQRRHILLISFLVVAFCPSTEAENYGSCLTYTNVPGHCMDVRECQYFHEITMLYPDWTYDILAKTTCSAPTHSEITVCCPDSHLSANGSFGDDNFDDDESDEKQLLQPPTCGVSLTDRIYGGAETELDEFPWMALLISMGMYGFKEFICGGALINSRYVLTAAHCVHGEAIWPRKLIEVRLGEWDTDTDLDCEVQANGKKVCNLPHVDVAVDRGISHPQYDPHSPFGYNDIALVRLAQPVAYTQNVQPICVPNPAVFLGTEFTGIAMDVAGWGETENAPSSNIKLKTSLRVWNLTECKMVYTKMEYVLNELQICAGGMRNQDSCHGDSGGPLMVELTIGGRSYFHVVGILSVGMDPCGQHGAPGIYTSVIDYWSWLWDTIETV